jgi:hypothetical protein
VICSQDFIYCRLGPQHGDIGGEETTKMWSLVSQLPV